jgi:hypothetical protein
MPFCITAIRVDGSSEFRAEFEAYREDEGIIRAGLASAPGAAHLVSPVMSTGAATHSFVLPDNIRMFQHVVARGTDVLKGLILRWQSAPWLKEEKANSVHGDAAFPSKHRRSQIRYVDERTARHWRSSNGSGRGGAGLRGADRRSLARGGVHQGAQ